MEFERYIPELKKYDTILFLHQPMTSGQPLKIVQRHMAHPVHTYKIAVCSAIPVPLHKRLHCITAEYLFACNG